jgi:hypothetical protein
MNAGDDTFIARILLSLLALIVGVSEGLVATRARLS